MDRLIRFIHPAVGSDDGIHSLYFQMGDVYAIGEDISEKLAKAFLDGGFATEVKIIDGVGIEAKVSKPRKMRLRNQREGKNDKDDSSP